MINTGDIAALAPHLPADFHYASQMVFDEIGSAAEFLAYMSGKLAAIAKSGVTVFAEMGVVGPAVRRTPAIWMERRPCVVLAQGDRERLVALVLATVEDGVLRRLDLCAVLPCPQDAIRTGEYPA